jgi:serine phosphatase RsbU (regulator of sigma subunit)
VRQRQLSPAGIKAWLILRQAMLLTLLSLVLTSVLSGTWRNILAGILAVVAALLVLRLHWPAVGARRFWRWSLLFALLFLLVPWSPLTVFGRVILSMLLGTLLIFRPYRFLPELGSGRRALTWLGSIVLISGFIGFGGPAESSNGVTGVLRHVHGLARFVLVVFWLMNIVWIFLGVRLHFLRMRPKLAVAGMLLAAVPVGLILTLGVLGAWSLLGAGRAEQASAVMGDWLTLVEAGALVGEGPFGGGFGDSMLAPGEAEVDLAWRADLVDAIAHAPFDPMPPAIWLTRAGELWALRIEQSEGRPSLTGGRRFDRESLGLIAETTGCVVGIFGDGDMVLSFSGSSGAGGESGIVGDGILADSGDSTALLLAWPASVTAEQIRGTGEGGSWIDRVIWFGGAPLNTYRLETDGLAQEELVLGLRTRPRDVVRYFTRGENELNRVIIGVLAGIAVVFLLFQLFAFYFGMRIVGGVTGAVGQLHKATERLARGDLDATISLPNEDEFGDLADSFNEMTTAIRVAQEQIVQKQLLEAQLDTARGIQQRLLPAQMPRIEGYQVAGSSDPSLQVGGDYFDFVEMPDGRLGIAVADVTGKGVPAALLMANVQAGLHGQTIHPGSAAEIIGRMNDLMYESTDAHMFVTFALILLDPATGSIESVSAGHEPTLLVRPDGSYEKLEAGGLMLGMLPGFAYTEIESRMEPGDVLVLYTDGVTEAMGPAPTPVPAIEASATSLAEEPEVDDAEDDDEAILPFFEEDRLIENCVTRRHESAEEIRRALLAAIRNFAQEIPQSDDITIVVIKREDAA